MKRLMVSCRQATALVEKQELQSLSLWEATGLFIHKLMCAVCRNYQKQSRFISTLLQRDRITKIEQMKDEELDELKQRIIEKIEL